MTYGRLGIGKSCSRDQEAAWHPGLEDCGLVAVPGKVRGELLHRLRGTRAGGALTLMKRPNGSFDTVI